jgi:hypothetical protein
VPAPNNIPRLPHKEGWREQKRRWQAFNFHKGVGDMPKAKKKAKPKKKAKAKGKAKAKKKPKAKAKRKVRRKKAKK